MLQTLGCIIDVDGPLFGTSADGEAEQKGGRGALFACSFNGAW